MYNAPAGGEFALAVVQHRPSRDPEYEREKERMSREFEMANGMWFSFGPVVFVNDTADGKWHRFIFRVVTDFGGKKPEAKLHIEVRTKIRMLSLGPLQLLLFYLLFM